MIRLQPSTTLAGTGINRLPDVVPKGFLLTSVILKGGPRVVVASRVIRLRDITAIRPVSFLLVVRNVGITIL